MSKRNLFEKRVNLMPYEYPELLDFRDAIRHSYWLTSEFNFSSDIQDYHVNVTPKEKSVLTKSMLAIAQIEVAVKLFWGDLYKYLPKPEINDVGVTFAECHIEGTEILTPSGWVNFKNITGDRLVCQFDARTKEISFAKPTKVIKNRYQGDIYRFITEDGKWVSAVTPNHRMLDFDPVTGEKRVVLAKDFDVSIDRVKYYGGYEQRSDKEIDNITLYSLDNPNIQKEVINYDGMIYCVTVPSGFIITRYEGTVSIEGNSECYSSDTEILTEHGWVAFPQLERGVRVATYNVFNNTIIFDRPYDYIEKDHDGYMHLYQSRNTNFLVTEGHELYVKNRHSGNIKRRKSKTILSMKNYTYPSSGMLDGEDRVLTYLERLLIAIQADGTVFAECPSLKGTSTTRIGFGLHKPKKIQRLKYLLDRLHITYQTRVARRNQTVITFSLKELADGLDLSTLKSFDWVDITRINASWGREFIHELSYWDCHVNRRGCYAYYNANIDALNKVQAIAALSGFRTKLHLYRRAEDCLKIPLPDGSFRKTSKDQYRLNISDIEQTTYPSRDVVCYSGKVYCVSVPSGAIVTRRNGVVGVNFNCRHSEAYASLLEILGMADMFSDLSQYPALMSRYDYMEAFMANKNESKSEFVLSLILFSLFVEHISLFGQFLVIMSFNKHKNMFKGISNAIEATSKEEEIHGRFGIALYGILKEEHPELFTEEFYQELTTLADSALKAEKAILHWIFEEGDLDFIDLATAENYIIHRYNNSLEILGIEAPYLVDERLLAKTRWFDEEVLSGKENDFFYKRSTDYSKKQKQITADDLF